MTDDLDNDPRVELADGEPEAVELALMEDDRVPDDAKPAPWPRWRPLPRPLRSTADDIARFPAV
jgi:hypothetical protein